MKLPEFLTDVATDENLAKVAQGVRSGYAIVAVLLIFTVIFDTLGVLPHTLELVTLAAIKLVANTWLWWTVRKNKGVLLSAIVNSFADVFLLTGAIYLTGGPLSALIAVYFVVLASISVVSNTGVTFLTAFVMSVCYGSMNLALALDWLEAQATFPALLRTEQEFTGTFLAADTAKFVLLMVLMAGALTIAQNNVRSKERELEENFKELQKANATKGEFVANVSHELRTPIHGILGLSEMLQEEMYGPINDKQRKALVDIDRSTRALLGMVDNLLSLERVNAGRLTLKLMNVDLDKLLHDVAEAGRWMAGTRSVNIVVEANEIGRVLTDVNMLRHCLSNLLSNAVKFSDRGEVVKLRATRSKKFVTIEVIDQGIGIPKKHHERIFEPFRQVDGSMSRHYGGSGVGLSVVKKLIDTLGGSIAVDSAPGKGATFRVKLPTA
jgi:signal transduction histidine kinase